jgi:nitrate reductase cytochrome c-type subunit
LCAQCHGPQARDFQHGAHGGMTGYWDLSKGPRRRNSCIDCHDPHAPKYPAVMPVFPPAESGLKSRAAGGKKR